MNKKEYDKKYYHKHKERKDIKKKIWYNNNKEKANEYTKKYRNDPKNKEREKINQKKWYYKNQKKILKKARKHYKENKSEITVRRNKIRNKPENRKKAKNYYLKKRFNLTLTEYNKIIKSQNNKCAICGKDELKKDLAVDHNHKTGKVRGLLCIKCNTTLGNVKDNISILKSCIKYLRKWEEIKE